MEQFDTMIEGAQAAATSWFVEQSTLEQIGVIIGGLVTAVFVLWVLWRIISAPFRSGKQTRQTETPAEQVTDIAEAPDEASADSAEAAPSQIVVGPEFENAVATLMSAAAAGGDAMSGGSDNALESVINDIRQKGSDAEREVILHLADGKLAEAAALYESDIVESADKTVEKLWRKATLFAPFDTSTAKRAYERLLALTPKNLDARNRLGHLLLQSGELTAAEEAYQAILANADDDQSWEAKALGNLGVIAQARGDLDTAQDVLIRSLEIDAKLGRKEGMANQLCNLGLIALTRGELDAAEDYLKRSLEIDEALGRKQGIATTVGNLGFLEKQRGNKEEAKALLMRARDLHAELGAGNGPEAQMFSAALSELGAVH
ncbi:MAG: tetratricopeptide repeat protein [Pseudomonadota bacterium]